MIIEKVRKRVTSSMSIYNQLSAQDRNKIADYIDRYAPEEGTNCDPRNLEYRLRFWSYNKAEYLYKLLGGNLILEREIEYETSIEELVVRYNKNANYRCRQFFNELYENLKNKPGYIDLLFESWKQGVNGCFCLYSYLADPATLMRNRWEAPEMILPLPDGKSFKVAPGTKITRILGRLAKEYNIPYWEDVRQAQADALTAKKTKGTLCLSIHPLDYMTMSDNSESWDSCMNWRDGGGYRAGTVEMMNSDKVIVAYMKHNTHKLEELDWNSKVWRELFIVTPEVITNIKAYPFQNSWLTKLILNWIKELAENALVSEYDPSLKLYSADSESKDDPWFAKNKITFQFTTDTMYNDCGRVDQWLYVQKDFKRLHPDCGVWSVHYSGERSCMYCGETDMKVDFDDEGSLLCDNCEYHVVYYCEKCGERIEEDEVFYVDDETYCHDCYHAHFVHPVDYPESTHPIEDCEMIGIDLPDGKRAPFFAHVLYPDTYIKKELRADDLIWEELPKDNDDIRYIPYKYSNCDLRIACGVSYFDHLKYTKILEGMSEEEAINHVNEHHPIYSLWA